MDIRLGKTSDIEACLDIYNYEVLHGVATLDLEARTLEEWQEWFQAHNCLHRPLFVAEVNHQVGGYATLSEYRTKEAFKSTVELSIYISPSHRGQGLASALMEHILDFAKADETIHLVVSVITAGNQASTHLHKKFGFTFCGHMPEVGYKKGVFQGVDHYYMKV